MWLDECVGRYMAWSLICDGRKYKEISDVRSGVKWLGYSVDEVKIVISSSVSEQLILAVCGQLMHVLVRY